MVAHEVKASRQLAYSALSDQLWKVVLKSLTLDDAVLIYFANFLKTAGASHCFETSELHHAAVLLCYCQRTFLEAVSSFFFLPSAVLVNFCFSFVYQFCFFDDLAFC